MTTRTRIPRSPSVEEIHMFPFRTFIELLLLWTLACAAGAQYAQQGGKLVPSDATPNSGIGAAVAISADGNTALISGGTGGAGVEGSVTLFTFKHGVWSQQKLSPTGAYAVALSADANTVILSTGAAFVRINGIWSQSSLDVSGLVTGRGV